MSITFPIRSKTHGVHFIKVDDTGFEKINNLGGKWCVVKKRGRFYAQKRINGKIVEMQRFLTNAPDGKYVDHINSNTLDNRRKNLRICTNAANLRNGRLRSNNRSGYTGVWRDKKRKKWTAEIKVNYKKIFLGRFEKIEDAIKARKKAKKKYWNI